MELWWNKHQGRLEFEMRLLKEGGISCELDEEAFARGVAILDLHADIPGYGAHKLRVIFPCLYPYMPFEIEAPDLTLGHHQNPFDKNLCLLNNAAEHWHNEMTVLEFIKEQVPRVLEAGMSDQRTELEAKRGEPASNYFRATGNSQILFDGDWEIPPEITGGMLLIGYNEQILPEQFRGGVIEVRDAHNHVLVEADPAIRILYSNTLIGRWIRFEAPPKSADPLMIFREIVSNSRALEKTRKTNLKQGEADVIGILFPEEIGWRQSGDGWLFLCREGNSFKPHLILAKGGRAGRKDMNGRNPCLAGLANKAVAVFGLGCLGAPCAIEFAKCGVGGLSLLDDDKVDPGTIVRWPFGLQTASGREKSLLIEFMLRRDYPYTKVCTVANWRIGAAQSANIGFDEGEVLDKMLAGANLVFDATANPAVNSALSALAAERGLPYIFISGTPGMWGAE